MRAAHLATFLAAIVAPNLPAQWHASVAIASTATSGYLATPDGSEFRPGAPREYTISVGRDTGPWRARLGGRVVRADLTVTDGEVSLSTHGLVRGTGAVADVSRRIIGDGVAPTLRVGLGGEYILWTVAALDDSRRWVAAATGSLEGSVAVGWRMRALLRGELVAGPSIFNDDVATEGYELRRGLRHGIAFGVSITP